MHHARCNHVRNAISLNRLLSSSSIKCAWCKILPRLCIVGATGCRGRSPTPVVRPSDDTDDDAWWCWYRSPVPWENAVGGGGAWAYVGDAGRCDASNIFDFFRPMPANPSPCPGFGPWPWPCSATGESSSVDLGRGFWDVNARRRFSIDDDVRVSRGSCDCGDERCGEAHVSTRSLKLGQTERQGEVKSTRYRVHGPSPANCGHANNLRKQVKEQRKGRIQGGKR